MSAGGRGAAERRGPIAPILIVNESSRCSRGSDKVWTNVRRLTFRCTAVAIAIACFPACSDSQTTPPSSVATDAHKNRDRWALPLDEYYGLNYSISDYAEALLIQECMEREGFAYPTGEPQRMDSPPAPTENDVYRSLFDAEIAAQYGYGGPYEEPHAASLTAAERSAIESDEGQAAFDLCVNEARKQLPPPPDRDLVISLSGAAYNSAVESDDVRKAAARWRACMDTLGISDLPATPDGMPTDSLRSQWGESIGGEEGFRPPSADEIKTAVHDAECRESSGFSESLYEAEWDVQEEMLAKNEDALVRLKAANDEHAGLVEDVLTSHG
jgi:hypothetical protein